MGGNCTKPRKADEVDLLPPSYNAPSAQPTVSSLTDTIKQLNVVISSLNGEKRTGQTAQRWASLQGVSLLDSVGFGFKPGEKDTQLLAGMVWMRAERERLKPSPIDDRTRMEELLRVYDQAVADSDEPKITTCVGIACALTSIPTVGQDGKHLYLSHWHIMQCLKDMVKLNVVSRGSYTIVQVTTREQIRVVPV